MLAGTSSTSFIKNTLKESQRVYCCKSLTKPIWPKTQQIEIIFNLQNTRLLVFPTFMRKIGILRWLSIIIGTRLFIFVWRGIRPVWKKDTPRMEILPQNSMNKEHIFASSSRRWLKIIQKRKIKLPKEITITTTRMMPWQCLDACMDI